MKSKYISDGPRWSDLFNIIYKADERRYQSLIDNCLENKIQAKKSKLNQRKKSKLKRDKERENQFTISVRAPTESEYSF